MSDRTIQGEGNRTADREYRSKTREFVEGHDVDDAARLARGSLEEADAKAQLEHAEAVGKARARGFDPEAEADPAESYETFRDILDGFDTVMLTTRSQDGSLRARPMAIAIGEDTGELWFVTKLDKAVTEQVDATEEALATMQAKRRYLTLKGHAELIDDRKRIEACWKPTWRLWFPKGPHDDDLRLIKFEPSQGEYWDYSGTTALKVALGAAKDLLNGEEIDLEGRVQHAQLDLGTPHGSA